MRLVTQPARAQSTNEARLEPQRREARALASVRALRFALRQLRAGQARAVRTPPRSAQVQPLLRPRAVAF